MERDDRPLVTSIRERERERERRIFRLPVRRIGEMIVKASQLVETRGGFDFDGQEEKKDDYMD